MIYENKKEKLIFLALLLMMVVSYIAGLFIDLTRDAAKYAFISKEMAESGDWFNLRIQGEYYTQKPQLLFWMSALSFKLLGISNFSFKLPVLLWSIFGIWCIYKLGRAMYGKPVGVMAAVMVFFSVVSVLYNMDIHTDIVLQTNIAFSLWMLYLFLTRKKTLYAILSGVAIGLLILTKGPFGLMVPFFATGGYLLSTRQVKRILDWRWPAMIVIGFLVSLPSWLFYFTHWGWEGVRFFVWTNNIGRVNGTYSTGITSDPFFFIHNLSYLFIPWSVILFISAFQMIMQFFRKKLTLSDQFIFWGIVVVFLILSFSKSKLPNYIVCLIPLMAIQTARSWLQYFQENQTARSVYSIVQNGLVYFLWAVVLAGLGFIFKTHYIWVLVALAGFLLILWFTRNSTIRTKLFLRSLSVVTAAALMLSFNIFPLLFSQQAQVQAAEILNHSAGQGASIYHFKPKNIDDREMRRALPPERRKHPSIFKDENHFYLNYELLFYSRWPIQEIKSRAELDSILTRPDTWIYTDQPGLKEIELAGGKVGLVHRLNHFNLSRSAKYINPFTRNEAIGTRFLLQLK